MQKFDVQSGHGPRFALVERPQQGAKAGHMPQLNGDGGNDVEQGAIVGH
jgi:hypothetical protein